VQVERLTSNTTIVCNVCNQSVCREHDQPRTPPSPSLGSNRLHFVGYPCSNPVQHDRALLFDSAEVWHPWCSTHHSRRRAYLQHIVQATQIQHSCVALTNSAITFGAPMAQLPML
jgi:hypothetical protein